MYRNGRRRARPVWAVPALACACQYTTAFLAPPLSPAVCPAQRAELATTQRSPAIRPAQVRGRARTVGQVFCRVATDQADATGVSPTPVTPSDPGPGLDRQQWLRGAAGAAIGVAGLAQLASLASAMEEASAAVAIAKADTKPQLVWTPLTSYDAEYPMLEQASYSPRFIAYMSRFLLNYDRVSQYWWNKQQTRLSYKSSQEFARRLVENGPDKVFVAMDVDKNSALSAEEFYTGLADQSENFSKFQASVSYGLRKYQGKNGVKRLFTLLLRDFGSTTAGQRQIALLFSLLDADQPVEYIKRLIAETDNASVVGFKVVDGGSGYEKQDPPAVTVDKPSFLENRATATAVLVPTGRIFRMRVTNPGKGYLKPPEVTVVPPRNGGKAATAIATIKGDKVAGIVVTNPGSGYTDQEDVRVYVAPPSAPENTTNPLETVSLLMHGAQAEVILDMKVAGVKVVNGGSGYGCDLPVGVTVAPPPPKVDYANYGMTAKVEAVLSPPPEGKTLRSWLPPTSLKAEFTELLPDNLIPKFDPCLRKFYISPIEVLDPNYCVYYEDSKFQVLPSQKMAPYFSFLDGPRARYPVEKERPLELDTFLRFALCGASCGAVAHAALVPIDVVKTKMQSQPAKYRSMLGTFKQIWKEDGLDAFLLGAGATIVGYLLYGGVSFGLTEYFKRKFVEVVGPTYATLYPVPLLLFASACAGFFGACVVTPFETIRIKTVTMPSFPKTLGGAVTQMVSQGQAGDLFRGIPVLLLAEIPFMMTKFAVFDATSKLAYSLFPAAGESVPLSLTISLVSGMIAGVAASFVSQPSDTILVEVNDDPENGEADVVGTIKDVYRSAGLRGFYKGAIPRALKSAVNIALQFFLYDFCKRLAQVSPDDIKVFFDVMSGLEVEMKNQQLAEGVASLIETLR